MNLLGRLGGLLCSPAKEWQTIAREDHSIGWLYLGWLLPLGLIVVLSVALGMYLYEGIGIGQSYALDSKPVLMLVWGAGLFVLQVTVLGLLVQTFAPVFGGQRHLRRAFTLVVFSMVGLQAGVALQSLLLPARPLLFLLGAAWSVYLLYSGMPLLIRVPQARVRSFSILLVITFWLINMFWMPMIDQQKRQPFLMGETPAPVEVIAHRDIPEERDLSSRERIQRADTQLSDAAWHAGNAAEQNDSLAAAQAASDAATALANTVAGGVSRRTLSEAQLRDWFPETLLGMQRMTLVVEPVGGPGSRTVQARGAYQGPMNQSIDLKVVDAGATATLLAESAANEAPNSVTETPENVAYRYRDGERTVSVLQWKNSEHLEVSILLANGVKVYADANGVALQRLNAAIQMLGLEHLEQDGSGSNPWVSSGSRREIEFWDGNAP